jgi:hypothetical protein
MSDFELDVSKPVGETVTIKQDETQHRYDVLPLTKSRVRLFQDQERHARDLKQRSDDGEDVDMDEAAQMLIAALSGLLGTQNGGPPAGEVLGRLWDEDILSFTALERLTQHLTEKAGSHPPA